MAMLSNLDLILRVPLLAHLTPEQAQTLADTAIKKRFKRGECIVEQGKSPHALFIILTGRARVVMTDGQGRQVILSTLKAGDHIGEVSLIDNDVHSANVSAELLTDVLMLGRKEFLRCLTENSSMAMAVMKALVKRLRSADRKISSLALTGVYGRVANTLLETAEPDEQGVLMIRGKVSRQDIAKMVGASREMVSRVMRDFEEKGFIMTLPNGAVRVNERRSRPR